MPKYTQQQPTEFAQNSDMHGGRTHNRFSFTLRDKILHTCGCKNNPYVDHEFCRHVPDKFSMIEYAECSQQSAVCDSIIKNVVCTHTQSWNYNNAHCTTTTICNRVAHTMLQVKGCMILHQNLHNVSVIIYFSFSCVCVCMSCLFFVNDGLAND